MTVVQHGMQQAWSKRLLILMAFMALGAMHAGATTYYVATNGVNGEYPTRGTQAAPWRTIAYAASKALAGDTVYIKGGNYGNEYAVVTHSGTSGSPITFEGYSGTVNMGTLPNPRTLPTTSQVGFKMTNQNYITLRNLNFTYYYDCVQVNNGDHVICDNLTIVSCGTTGGLGSGIYYNYSDYGEITDCTVTNAGGNNVFLAYCNNCTIDNLLAQGTLPSTDQWCTDYYCVMRCCSNCTIQNSVADDVADSQKGNHGFIIKDLNYTPHSTGNLIQDCYAYSMEEGFSAAYQIYGNTFLRCHVDNSAKGTGGYNACFICRNGAYNNTFRECDGIGRYVAVSFCNYSEGAYTGSKYGNQFINCKLIGSSQSYSIGVFYDDADNNSFTNCVFDKVNYFGRWINGNTGNSFKNSIITGIPVRYDTRTNLGVPLGNVAGTDGSGGLTVTYCDFYNTFGSLGSTGILTTDPFFASTTDYHLKSTGGRWNGSIWVTDTDHSPCIDAGDTSDYSNEPTPNGDRINMGRYGNTAEASKSATAPLPANMDNRLKESTPDTPLSSNTFLDVGFNGTGRYRDITWFDMEPYMDDDPNTITDAKLSMYWYFPTTTRAADTVVQIMKPESGWDHAYTCWNKKSNGVNWTYAGGDWTDYNGTSQGSTPFASVTFPAGTTTTSQYYDWNVTQLVKEIVTAGSNPGMFIKASSEGTANYIAFYGAANASNRPKLSITRIASQTEGTAASDNRLKQSTPDTPLLTSTFNDVGGLSGTNYRGLIWFDLSPFADVETITSAKLSLYWYYPSSTRVNDTVVDIYRPATGWDKNYVTWNTKASGVAWSNAGGDWYDANSTSQGSTPFASVTIDNAQLPTNQYYEFDVTALVNYYRSTGTNAGFFIKARTEGDNYIGFYSLNNASYKPKLEITSTISQ